MDKKTYRFLFWSIILQIQIIPENSIVQQNFDERRVRIIVDREQTVIKTPHVG